MLCPLVVSRQVLPGPCAFVAANVGSEPYGAQIDSLDIGYVRKLRIGKN
jgi:hypothetical protein